VPAPAASHRFTDHTGELCLEVRAPDLGGVLAEAGRALAALQARGATPAPDPRWRELGAEGRDPASLLVAWLNELVWLADAERWVANEFVVEEAGDTRCRVRARGGAVEALAGLVKAATHHGAAVAPMAGGGLRATVVLDV
jgi:SHS2 domain-containing protein